MAHQPTRAHVRIHFPAGRRPRLIRGGGDHEVLDLSAQGLLFVLPSGQVPPALGARIEGTLALPTSATLEVRGRVVWVEGGRVGVHLGPEAIPDVVLLAEERALVTARNAR